MIRDRLLRRLVPPRFWLGLIGPDAIPFDPLRGHRRVPRFEPVEAPDEGAGDRDDDGASPAPCS